MSNNNTTTSSGIAERIKQQLEDAKRAPQVQQQAQKLKQSNAKWKIFQSRYLYPSLAASVFLGVYYMYQAYEVRFETEAEQEQQMQETFEREKSSSKVGFFKLRKEKDVEQKAEEFGTKFKPGDYDMKVVPKEDKE